jgi:ABC-type transport system involved in multi-copper enzyme maturation permease subunit
VNEVGTFRRPRRWGLPLLSKELAEQSGRKRTYVIRTLYACLLAGFALLMFWAEVYHEISSPFEVLGQGREMFMVILALQFAGVYLFMPAITCAVITSEKERNTIGLLLLTKLGPWTILLEKLMGRLVPMLTFLLLAMPLMGFTYAMGGVTQQQLWISLWALLITILQVGALALACSAFFRTTVAAFIATYVIGFLMYFGPVFLMEFFPPAEKLCQVASGVYCEVANAAADSVADVWAPLTGNSNAVPPEPLDIDYRSFSWMSFAPAMLMDPYSMSATWHVIPRSLGVLLTIPFWLLVARLCIVRRAFAPSRNWLLGTFKRLDGVFQRINQNRFTKGVVVIRDSATLPGDEPIAWRETKKKSLGTTRYLVRIFVATEFPVFAMCLLLSLGGMYSYGYRTGGREEISVMLCIVWVLVVLLVSVKATSLVSSERSHETLDVLLSTPMRCSDMVRQKFRGIRRLMLVLAMPLMTIIVFQMLWRQATHGFFESLDEESTLLYLISSVLSVAIYLPMVAWVSFYVGLRVRSQVKAIFASLAIIVGWCALPVFALAILDEMFRIHVMRSDPLAYLFLLSPASIIPFTEFSALDELNNTPWLAMFFNYAYYAAILLVVRWACLDGAPRFLRRTERPRRPFDSLIGRRQDSQPPARRSLAPPVARS